MNSLKGKALQTLIKGKSLSQVLALCKSNQVYMDTCFESPTAFKQILMSVLGDVGRQLLGERLDLVTLEQLLAFADGLSKGFSFNYGFVLDEDGDFVGQPVPLYDITLEPGHFVESFHIDGLLPESGVGMILFQIFVQKFGGLAVSHAERCFYYLGQNHPEIEIIINWIAGQVVTYIKKQYEMGIVVLRMDEDMNPIEIKMVDSRNMMIPIVTKLLIEGDVQFDLEEKRLINSLNIILPSGSVDMHFSAQYLMF